MAKFASPEKIDDNTQFARVDFRNVVQRFTPKVRKANQALVELLTQVAAQKRRRQLTADDPRAQFLRVNEGLFLPWS